MEIILYWYIMQAMGQTGIYFLMLQLWGKAILNMQHFLMYFASYERLKSLIVF